MDYISDDSTESEREEKEDERQMADAQQRGKTAESDRSDGEEEEEEEEEEAELTEAGKEINALIKKQQSVDAPSSDEGEGEEEGDAMDQGTVPPTSQGTKRPLEEGAVGQDPSQPQPKRVHVEDNPGMITDKEVLHYLARKPITTKDLVRKFQRRKTDMDKKQVVALLGNILPRLNVEKKKIKDKIYLSLRPTN